jgi:hypothetical protein
LKAAWPVLLLLVGCYSPSYTNGGFLCGSCPDGYHCALDNTCWKNGEDPDLAAELVGSDLGPDLGPDGFSQLNLVGGVEPLAAEGISNGQFVLTDQSLLVSDRSCAANFCLVGGITP